EEEQHFYIQQLFNRYGQGRLDFHGFQSLLFSLGLGEVKVVGVKHDELGHDHVSHLGLLDVQGGLHMHSPVKEGQDGHEHSHGHPHHDQDSHDPHTEPDPKGCNHQTTADTPIAGRPAGNELKHGHDHDHDIHRVQTGTVIPNTNQDHQPSLQTDSSLVRPEPPSSTSATPSQPKRPKKSAQIRGQRSRSKITPPPSTYEDHGPQSGHSHDHLDEIHRNTRKDKREVAGGLGALGFPSAVFPLHQGKMAHQHEECLNLTQLLHYYGLNPDSPISPNQFTYLCPALLYQIDSRVCIRHYPQMTGEQKALEPGVNPSDKQNLSELLVWLWGFVSITIISLLSLLGVVLVPFLKQSCFKFLLTFLVALAVGTLSGDALLHLLPHSQGSHDHSKHGHSHDINLGTAFDGVWKGLTALGGIYLLFIIEHCIGMFKHYKDHRSQVMKKVNEEGKIGRKLSDHKLNRRSDAEWLHLKPLSEDPETCTTPCDNSHNDTQLTEIQTAESPANKLPLDVSTQKKEQKAKHHRHSHSHGHSHGGNCHSDQEMKDAGIASIAWMVIMGDGMHNFSDGLAIGAAFSAHLTGGISTSVAVFCHELPHELGDFAVLLKAGMSVKQAIVYNLLSALMAYVGMMIGTAVGQYTENVTSWIFAITAGMFLYVALVDMLPEMLHGDSEDHKRCQLGHFILQNLGMLTGFAIMLLIAIFEDQIVFDFRL
uniref:Solute carrier family 39 member 10 n=1 Tax=Tetraodon nigroviridis TaxID=99883 RepID=H3CTZ9_TETNG